jgi:hypothetical protein
MYFRLARLALVAIALHLSSACQVYDAGLSSRPAAGDADAMVMMLPEGGTTKTDAHTCKVDGIEVCNGADDDCDGVIDEMAAVQVDCESRVVHAQTVCQSGYCLRISCLTGYYNCDGRPENGCEAACPCGASCGEDAGSDNDAGS